MKNWERWVLPLGLVGISLLVFPDFTNTKWLGVFLQRFFQTSQYKRSAVPNAPKVGSGGSLSPRGDWRAPSDGNADAWLASLADVPARE